MKKQAFGIVAAIAVGLMAEDVAQERFGTLRCSFGGGITVSGLINYDNWNNSAQPTLGEGYELDAIASVALGGTSMNGGRGLISGTFVGVLIIAVLSNGLNIIGVSSYYQQVVKGIVILIAVLSDRKR